MAKMRHGGQVAAMATSGGQTAAVTTSGDGPDSARISRRHPDGAIAGVVLWYPAALAIGPLSKQNMYARKNII